jgi:excisionase family DNA binding protein
VKEEEEESEMITTEQAGRLRGVSGKAIRELIRRGRLRAKMMYGRLLVYRSEVLTFKKDKPGPRGPRKSTKKES